MSKLPEGRYAMIIVTEVGDNTSTIGFERIQDYAEYLMLQQEVKQDIISMFDKKEEVH